MSTTTKNHQPAPRSTLRRLVARHPVAAFLFMLYTITWIIFLPVVLQGRGLLALPIDLSEGLAFNTVVAIASILGTLRFPPSSSRQRQAARPVCATCWAGASGGASEHVGT